MTLVALPTLKTFEHLAVVKREPGAAQHRCSIIPSHPAAPGSILSDPKKIILMLLRFTDDAGLRIEDRSLTMSIEPI